MVNSVPVLTMPTSGFSPEPAKVFFPYKCKLYGNAVNIVLKKYPRLTKAE
jgi:hypothetical protein